MYKQIDNWTDYLHLREQNQLLQNENIRLRTMLSDAWYAVDTSYTALERYAYFPAKVINKTVNRQFNYLTIDRGKKGNISEGMAVIGTQGIVGIVFGVSEHFATVLPVINNNFRISVKLQKNNHMGTLSWDGQSYRHALLNEISLHVPVSVGDTVVTSGFSRSLPEGIKVGVISNIEQKDGSFFTIEVLLATDFRRLNYVTIIDALMQDEQERLEQQIINMR